MFQLKDFQSLTASMLNHLRGVQTRVTDVQPGSVARTMIEAPAVEIEEAYMQFFIGVREAIPVATFQSFGFDKLPASYAYGYVSVSRETALAQDIIIPEGTSFASADGTKSYTSTSDAVWSAGATVVTIPVLADVAGTSGNAGAGTITTSPTFDDDYTISNQAITNGTDEESDEARQARFAEFVQSLSRGTDVACLYAAGQATVNDSNGSILERVTREGYEEIAGYVRIFLYSSKGVPSAELIERAQGLIDGERDPDTGDVLVVGFRAAGIRIDILPMAERKIPMTIGVKMRSGYALTSAVRQTLSDTYSASIRNIANGDTLLIENLRAQLLTTPNVLEISLSSTENITCAQSEALVPGTITITAL